MIFNRYLARFLRIYLISSLFIIVATYIYYFVPSPYFFILIISLTFMIAYLVPLIMRYLFKARPYRDKYYERLMQYARDHHVNLKDIYVRVYHKKDSHFNAMAIGLFNNKVVVFTSSTIDNCPYDELTAVMAHELGHYKNSDQLFWTILVAITLMVMPVVNLKILSLLTDNPQLIIAIGFITSFILMPGLLFISRWREDMADQYAFKILGHHSAFVRFFKRAIDYEKQAGREINKTIHPLFKLFLTHSWIYDRMNRFDT